jgi:citrate synthase
MGLDGVVAARTRLSEVDGERGRLTIAGFPVEVLAPRATFEDAAFLLWNDRLPTAAERAATRAALAAARVLDPVQRTWIERLVGGGTAPMDVLRIVAGTLGAPHVIAAAIGACRAGRPIGEPDPGASHAADLLRLLRGVPPTPAAVRALDTWLVTVCDHGLNASTFAARVVISTGSGLTDAVVAAIGALKGPLHGGAPGPALQLVRAIARADRAPEMLAAELAAGRRLMGFGHRIYRVRDPRAEVLDGACRALHAAGEGDPALAALARAVEAEALRLLAAHKPGRPLRTNVEFYTALLLDSLGIPDELFTAFFAAARSAGWTAHAIEQRREGRLIRPSSEYVGAHDRAWPG